MRPQMLLKQFMTQKQAIIVQVIECELTNTMVTMLLKQQDCMEFEDFERHDVDDDQCVVERKRERERERESCPVEKTCWTELSVRVYNDEKVKNTFLRFDNQRRFGEKVNVIQEEECLDCDFEWLTEQDIEQSRWRVNK